MTAQIEDTFIHKRKSYSISAIQTPSDFFNIQKIGIDPEGTSTACWRGYVAEFSIHEDKLVLKNLDTNNSNGKAFPIAINGVMPEIEKSEGLVEAYKEHREWHYKNVNLILPYTGGILITDKFIRNRYIHMGFQSPLSYEVVIELYFENGVLIKEKDLSEEFAVLRKNKPVGSDNKFSCLPQWIEQCFDLSYKSKYK